MRKVLLIILLFFTFSNFSFALTPKEVIDFQRVRGAETSYYYEAFLKKYPDSPFKKVVVNILSELYLKEGKLEKLLSLDSSFFDDYHLLKYAKALKLTGKEKEAKNIYLKLFKLNDFDEEIILDNLGNTHFLFSNETVIRSKIWRAIVRRNFDMALFYLTYLPQDSKYFSYLKGVYEYKRRNYKTAKLFLKSSMIPESTFYLLLMERNPFKRVEYLKVLLNSSARKDYKRIAVRITLNKFLVYHLPLCKRVFPFVKNFDSDLYNEYAAKYYFNIGNFKKSLFYLNKLNKPWAKGLAVAVKKSIYKKRVRFNNLSDFYRFTLVGDKVSLAFKEPKVTDITDSGLKYIVENKIFDLLEVLMPDKFSAKDLAVAFYLAKKYRKAIKYAYLSKTDSPIINRIKYPTPKVFGKDVIALSIARQESLFDGGAFSRSGAIGYMQIMPMTGKYISRLLNEKFILSNLYDEKINVRYGTYYIKSLMKQFRNFPIAAAAYNGGPGRMKKLLKLFGEINSNYDLVFFLDTFLYLDETRDYVKKVVTNCFYYSSILEKHSSVCAIN